MMVVSVPDHSHRKPVVSTGRPRTDVRINPRNVIVIDHTEIFRAGIRSIVSGDDRYAVLEEHRAWHEAASAVLQEKPDVVIVEWAEVVALQQNPREVRALHRLKAKMLVTALSFTLTELMAVLKWGAGGVVLKSVSSAHLLEAIDHVAEGRRFVDFKLTTTLLAILYDPETRNSSRSSLTRQERRLLPILAEGLTNKEIARRLGLSDKTIKNHVARVFRKLYVANRAQFAARYARGDYLLMLPTKEQQPPDPSRSDT